MNGAATRSSAATSPAVNDPNTTQAMRPRASGAEGDGGPDPSPAVGTGIGVVATRNSIRCSGGARVQPSAPVTRADISTVNPPPRYWTPVSYTHLRAHETVLDLVCRLLLEKK